MITNIKNHMNWSWIIIIAFFILSTLNIRFGILGILCMTMPLIHALRGHGKVHCIKHCPRGSFLGRFLNRISLNRSLPNFMKSRIFKNTLLLIMASVLSFALYHTQGDLLKLSHAFYRFMGISFIVGITLGILFKPRSWCVVCPMGHATTIIKEIQLSSSVANTKQG